VVDESVAKWWMGVLGGFYIFIFLYMGVLAYGTLLSGVRLGGVV
jgi:hypothetical protein